jgi:hypothetical protein
MRHAMTVGLMVLLAAVCAAGGKKGGGRNPCPDDLTWLRKECGDGALAYQDRKHNLYLTELLTGKTEHVGHGTRPEFSPDSSKLAWIAGDEAVGRMRKGDETIHTIAEDVDEMGGVHWISNDEVVVLKKDRKWYRVALDGRRREVPELTRLGRVERECDVKLRDNGSWAMVCGRRWKTTDGKSGKIPGRCSVSLSPDGKSITSLCPGHKEAALTPIAKGGRKGRLKWVYTGARRRKGFDNHRWSSNDPRFVVVVAEGRDKKTERLAVMQIGTTRAVCMGHKGKAGAEYGDFTVGDGKGHPWPKKLATPKLPERKDLVLRWVNAQSANKADGRVCRLERAGSARIGRHYDLLPAGGAFAVDAEVTGGAMAAVAKAGEVSIELLITSQPARQADRGEVLRVAGKKQRFLAICQEGDGLYVWLGGTSGKPAKLCGLRNRQPRYVAVCLGAEGGTAYVDGKKAADLPAAAVPPLKWKAAAVQIGSQEHPWHGRVEGLALYARMLKHAEIEADHKAMAAALATRKAPETVTVQALLKAKSPLPDVGNYPQAMVVYRYEIRKVLDGKPKGKTLLVAHRGAVNGREVKSVTGRKVGSAYRLTVLPFDACPQLRAYQRSDDVSADALDAALMTDAPR